MKKIKIIILILFITTKAFADCTNSGIYCLSKSSMLNKNGIVILEFYASSQTLVPHLNKKYPIYLKSLNNKIQLNTIETLIGEMRVTQVVLKPTLELKEGEIYTLLIDNLPKNEQKLFRWNNLLSKREELTFEIKNFIDKEIPFLITNPTEQKKTLVYYGCGPASLVYFNIDGQDKSELFVKANVTDLTKQRITTFILPLENGSAKIGHGMCSGAFSFLNNNFKVTFQLLDQSGNYGKLTSLISFSKPTISTNNE